MGKVKEFPWYGVRGGGTHNVCIIRLKDDTYIQDLAKTGKARFRRPQSFSFSRSERKKKACWLSASRVWVSQRQSREENTTRLDFNIRVKCAAVLPFGLLLPLLNYY